MTIPCAVGSIKLILCDTTEIDYKRPVKGLGPVGKGKGHGYFLHTGLMRDALSGKIDGMAGQKLFYRQPKAKTRVAKNTKRRDTKRESVVWGQLIDQIGPAPAGVQWYHVCDRGADDYEVYLRAYRNGCGWVIRACRLNRQILDTNHNLIPLEDYLASQPRQGQATVEVPRQGARPARTAEASVRYASLRMPTPSRGNAWITANQPEEPLLMSVVALEEEHPPQGAEALHWVLLTSDNVRSSEDALRCVEYYRLRWGVEEYHKALKTGCQVEHRYYPTAARLERVTGLLSVLAMRLLQIRSLAIETPDRPAQEVIPPRWVKVLAKVRKCSAEEMTLAQFVRHLAGLGGHLGRKRDGHPGWITLWRGLEKLLLILRGASL